MDSSAIPLTWCDDCASFTQDRLGHLCAHTVIRRHDLRRAARRWDRKVAYQSAYNRRVSEARRERQLRTAS